MRSYVARIAIFLGPLIWIMARPGAALATQTHGGAEGLIAHQLAHLFYLVSMGVFIYWLRKRRLVAESGWRMIQFAAALLIIWNFDTFFVHLLDETPGIIRTYRLSPWTIRIETEPGFEALASIYYLAKLDHLFCVPALWLLYIGLKRLSSGNLKAGGDVP